MPSPKSRTAGRLLPVMGYPVKGARRDAGKWAALLSLLILCSCVTEKAVRPPLPTDVAMNHAAGRWSLLFVTLRLENGEELPLVLDTGASWTLLDQSLEPQLGKRLGTTTFKSWNGPQEAGVYAAPKLSLGNTPLKINSVVCCDLEKLPYPCFGRGILGMDCLQHYCIQLDFEAQTIRFLDSDSMSKAELGKSFPLTFQGNLPYIQHPSLVGGKSNRSLIDTGYDVDGRILKGSVAGQESEIVRLPECVWDGEIYTDLAIRPGDNASLLGLRFLARHRVTLDFPERTMYLKKTSTGPLAEDDTEAAIEFLKSLKESGQLPGSSRDEKGTISADPHLLHTLNVRKNGISSIYHYTVKRSSPNGQWTLRKAWRTDQAGNTLEQYFVP